MSSDSYREQRLAVVAEIASSKRQKACGFKAGLPSFFHFMG